MSYVPSFAIINAQELQRLNDEGASASVMSVYLALCAFAQGDASCFPSLDTIKAFIKGSITTSTISKCLRWLRERKFIVQNHRTSKKRFEMVYRNMVKSASSLVQRAKEKVKKRVHSDNRGHRVHSDNRPKNQRGKPFIYKQNKYRRKKEMGYGRFGAQNDADNGSKCVAESVFANWLLHNPNRDIRTISNPDFSAIITALTSNDEHDREWREIMRLSPQNSDTFDLLLKEGKLRGTVFS